MAAINFGNGPNTSSGDTVKQALEKLQARIDALQGGIPPADTTPDAFTFADAANVAPGSAQASNWEQITGINASASWTATGGLAQVANDSSGSGATTAASNGTVAPNKWMRVTHTASSSNSTGTSTTLTIGGVSYTFTSTTVAASAALDPAYDATIVPPFIQLEGTRDTVPLVVIVQTDPSHRLGGKYRLLVDEDAAFGSPATYEYTPTLADFSTGVFDFGLASLTGTQRIRGYWITSDNKISGPSNYLLWGPNDVAPALSNLTAFTNITSSAARSSVTTDWSDGNLYALDTLISAPPTAEQVEDGRDAADTAAAWAGNQAITSVGAKTFISAGLTQGTTYYRWYMHKPAVGPRSAVLAGGSFETAAGSPFSYNFRGLFHKPGGASSWTYTAVPVGTPDPNRKIYFGGWQNVAVSSCKVNGNDAVRVNPTSGTIGALDWWEAAIPDGEEVTIDLSGTFSSTQAQIAVWTAIGASVKSVVTHPGGSVSVANQKITVTTPEGQASLVLAYTNPVSGAVASGISGATYRGQTPTFTTDQTVQAADRMGPSSVEIAVTGTDANASINMSALQIGPA